MEEKQEIEVIDIRKEIVKQSISAAAIVKMAEEFKDLSINGIDDKEGYGVVKKAKSLVVGYRNKINNVRKEIKRDADSESKLLLRGLEPIETQLTDKLFVIDAEIIRIQEEKDNAEKARISERINKVISSGMVFNGKEYKFKDLMIGNDEIKEMSDQVFNNFIISVDIHVAAEKKRLDKIKAEEDAEKERLRLQKIELDKKDRELKEREWLVKKEEREIAERARIIKEQAEKKEKEEIKPPVFSKPCLADEKPEKVIPDQRPVIKSKSDAAKEKEAYFKARDKFVANFDDGFKLTSDLKSGLSEGFKAGARWYKDYINVT